MAGHELDIADDIEASEYFNLAVLNNGVTLKVSEPLVQAELPPRRNLFAVSNLFGLAVAGTNNGFAVFTLSALRQAYTSAKQRTQAPVEPLRTVAIGDGGLSFVKIGLCDKVVIASGPALQGGIGVWRLKSLVEGTSTEPLHVFPPASNAPLVDVLPNPGDRPELLALLYQDGQIVMINLDSKATIGAFGEGITAACWSVRGKQIVTGDHNGDLVQFTPEGEPKVGTDAPTSLRGRGLKVLDIRWVENAVFFVTYCDAENPMDTSIFVSTRAKDGSVTYAPILDPLMVESMDRPEARFNAWMKNWTPFKHLLLVCNATSNTIGHVGLGPVGEGGNTIAWSSIKNDLYTTLPLETYPIGLEIDYTDTTVPLSEENVGSKPLPTLWSYASDGSLSAWRIVNLQGEQYPSIAAPHDIVTQEDAARLPADESASAPKTVPAVPSVPAVPAALPFGSSSTGAAFGSTAFGSGTFSSPPSFGRPPSFGAPPSFAPAFGQAAFGSTPAFGKPVFGQPAIQPASVPAKGGFSGFSQQTTAFASPSASAASSPFASSAASPPSTPAFAASQPTTFGSSTFGQAATASGTVSMATSPAPAAFGQSNPFGAPASSTTSPFGSTKPASSPFGSFASKADNKTSSSGFGAFSSGTPSSSSGFSFGASTTGEPTKNAFGVASSSPFGALREGTAATATPAVKPPGLDETDAEDMEPVNTASLQGGALDFGNEESDDDKQANTLSFGGLGFGGDKKAPPASTIPSAFGSLPKASPQLSGTSAASSTPTPFAFKTKTDTIDAKPAFDFSGSGENSEASVSKQSPSTSGDTSDAPKATFSFAKPAQTGKESGADTSTKSPSPFSFGNTSSATPEKGESSVAPSPFGGFGKPATFGQTSPFGQASAFAQPSTFGQKSAFGTPSTPSGKPAFSFGNTSSDKNVSGGFAGFASSSASNSKSPFSSPLSQPATVSPTFGQPGLFKAAAGEKATPTSSPKEKEEQSTKQADANDAKGEKGEKETSQVSELPASAQPQKESDAKSLTNTQSAPETAQEDESQERDAQEHDSLDRDEDDEEDEDDDGDEDDEDEELYKRDVNQEVLSQQEEWTEEEVDYVEEDDDDNDDDDDDDDEEVEEDAEEKVDEEAERAATAEAEDEEDDEKEDEVDAKEDADEEEDQISDEESENETSELVLPDEQRLQQTTEDKHVTDNPQEPRMWSEVDAGHVDAKPPSDSSPAVINGEGSPSPPASPSPAPPVSKEVGTSAESPPSSFTPARSAFSFAPAQSSKLDQSDQGSKASWSFGETQADQGTPKATSTAPAGFGKAASGRPVEGLPNSETVNSSSSTETGSGPSAVGKSTSETSTSTRGPANVAGTAKPVDSPRPFGLGNLQKATPRTSSPLASMPAFAPPASPSQTQSSFDLSNLSSAPSSPSASPSKFSQTLPVSPTPQSRPPLPKFFDEPEIKSAQKQPKEQSQQQPLTAEPAQQDPNSAVLPLSAPPKLSSSILRTCENTQLSQDTLNIFITMQDHLDALKESAAACMSFFHSVQPARLPKDASTHPTDVLAYDGVWGMGDLPRLREATRSLSKALAEVAHQAKDEEKVARSLEGSLLKIKAKSEEINRYLRAREDPQVAKMVRVRQLGPEQLENQTRIRKQTQSVSEALVELERTILSLKDKVQEEKLGRAPMQTPSLDSIYRAIRNLTSGLQAKVAELDDIALRLDMMTLSTSSHAKHKDSTPRVQRSTGASAQSPRSVKRSSSYSANVSTSNITARVERNVRRALAAEEFGQQLKEAWLAKHKEPLLNKTANKASH